MSKPTKHTSTTNQSDKLKRQVEELTSDIKRIQADFVNYKRRAEQDKQRAIRFGRESAIMALLPAIDNIDRALSR